MIDRRIFALTISAGRKRFTASESWDLISRTDPQKTAIALNYFAHGYRFVDRPYFLAGTAIPDALGAIDRRVRVRRKNAILFVDDCDPIVAETAAGIVQHHDDDGWFHSQRAFAELSLAFAQEIRALLTDDKGLRAGFLGHIIVELLLDAELIGRHFCGADGYYQALELVEGSLLQQIINRLANRPASRLADFLAMFIKLRFLEDYADDERLLMRLNQVMHRVGLAPIERALLDWFPTARRRVGDRFSELQPQTLAVPIPRPAAGSELGRLETD